MESYRPENTCTKQILFELDGDILTDVKFIGGCSGNNQGIRNLVVGMPAEDVIEKLEGIQCKNGTSCPDQLAKAIRHYLEHEQ